MSTNLIVAGRHGRLLDIILNHARTALARAETSAAVLEANKVGNLARHVAKVTGADKELHGDCIRMITRSEMMLSARLDAGKDAGEVAGVGRPAKNPRASGD